MQESYIESDPDQQIKLEINDYEDAVYAAYRHGYQAYIDQMRVKVLDYEILGVLVHQHGHRARIWVGYFGDHCATHFGHVVPVVSGVIVPV